MLGPSLSLLSKIHNEMVKVDPKGKGPNGRMEKVRIDQEKRSELIKDFFLLRSKLTNNVRSELTSGRGPN